MKLKFKSVRASISLISVLIISAFTLVLVVAMSETNISTSYQALNNSSNRIAYYLAESCLEEAMIRLESDPTYSGGSIDFDADSSCSMTVSGSGPYDVLISVSYLTYVQSFDADVSLVSVGEAYNATLLLWQEI